MCLCLLEEILKRPKKREMKRREGNSFFACETAEKGKCNGRVFDKKGDCSGIKAVLMWLSGCPECCCRQSSGSSHLEVTLLFLFYFFFNSSTFWICCFFEIIGNAPATFCYFNLMI